MRLRSLTGVGLVTIAAWWAHAGPPPTKPADADVVTVTIRSKPVAEVRWGATVLGVTPLVLQYPRDSGPLDLVLSAAGHLPVHTRAYTFKDDTLNVKLTPLAEQSTLLGYKQTTPPDAGVSPPPSMSDEDLPGAPPPSTPSNPAPPSQAEP